MKDFFNFLSEARVSKAAEKAKKLGLSSDGSGGWVDRQGQVQARTVGGELVFSQKRSPSAEKETTGRVAAAQEDPKAKRQSVTGLRLRNLVIKKLMVIRRMGRKSL